MWFVWIRFSSGGQQLFVTIPKTLEPRQTWRSS
ncbi:hypothetical protein OOU_Y34scaffold00669g93 [Pyricularia oryzae Y34]|uniref:Uncharacterized protein n=1 Tax=Pyricularia oryzae (strain Y34) TaxID=1143189 RepID=A0AA97NTU8_PYRO3|nr:hypothetical protein OOU_Y34scaffold00669g93 [Pyricularia oryzae Y34]